jgi:hypothetical protein
MTHPTAVISIVNLDSGKVPRKSAPKPASRATSADENGNLMALFAQSIDKQQESIKKSLSMIASSDNQIKQFKAKYSKNDSSNGSRFEKKSCSIPPWMDDKPTDPAETKQWDNCTLHHCLQCKQGCGSWSPSHSTAGNAAKGIAAHHGGKSPYTKRNSTAEAPGGSTAKKDHFDKPLYCSTKAAFASNGKSLQELLKSCRAAAPKDEDH